MSWIDGLRHRLSGLLHPDRHERGVREELEFHQALDAGQQGDEAVARRRFGNRTYYQEEVRRMTWLSHLDVLRQDASYAWRSIRRSPSFTIMVVVTLALGLGLNAATFSVVDQLYLRPPAGVAASDDVRRLWIESFRTAGRASSTRQPVNFPMFRRMAESHGDTARFVAIASMSQLRLGGTRQGPLIALVFATGNYFSVLGVRPELGRLFSPDDDRIGASRVLVVSHEAWTAHFGADSTIVGREVLVDTTRYTVIGVASKGFTGIDIEPSHYWAPSRLYPQAQWLQGKLFESPNMYIFRAFYRRAPGVDDAAFEKRASLALRELSQQQWKTNADTLMNVFTGPVLEARGPGDQAQERAITTRLGGVSIIILIIACANVINLLLARATARRREIAVRLALGISRGRLIRLLTTETVLLALLAAGAAVATAWWGGTALRALLLPNIEWSGSTLHWRVVAFAFSLALVAGTIAGLIPALQFTRPRLSRALRDGADARVTGRSRLRDGLLVAQAALSMMLLVGAGLFVLSLRNVRQIDIGFDADRLLFGRVAFDPGQAPPIAVRAAKIREAQERLRGRPGIEGTARVAIEPMQGMSFKPFYWGADSSASITRDFPSWQAVTPDFFATAGIRFLRGRTMADGAEAEQQVVINETMAGMLWPGQDALGQCIRFGRRDASCHVVAGIVETANQRAVIESNQPQFYLAIGTRAAESQATVLVVRVAASAEQMARREIEAILAREFPGGYPVVTAMTENLERHYRPWRLGATLFTGAGALALLVALVGIYSSVSYGVSQRTREFGVRMALGARVTDVARMVVEDGLRVVLVGVAAGVVLALAAGRLLTALLFGVQPADPSVLLLASSALLLVAGFAALLPALRASRVDPAIALRAE